MLAPTSGSPAAPHRFPQPSSIERQRPKRAPYRPGRPEADQRPRQEYSAGDLLLSAGETKVTQRANSATADARRTIGRPLTLTVLRNEALVTSSPCPLSWPRGSRVEAPPGPAERPTLRVARTYRVSVRRSRTECDPAPAQSRVGSRLRENRPHARRDAVVTGQARSNRAGTGARLAAAAGLFAEPDSRYPACRCRALRASPRRNCCREGSGDPPQRRQRRRSGFQSRCSATLRTDPPPGRVGGALKLSHIGLPSTGRAG